MDFSLTEAVALSWLYVLALGHPGADSVRAEARLACQQQQYRGYSVVELLVGSACAKHGAKVTCMV